MLWQRGEIRHPVRVHAPVRLEESAHPVQRLRPALVRRILHGVVQADESRAAFHLLCHLLEVVVLQQEMPAAAVAVKDDGVRLREFLGAGPLRAQVRGRRDRQAAFIQAFFEKEHPRIVLVLARPVGLLAGEEEDVLFSAIRGKSGRGRQREDGDEDETRECIHSGRSWGRGAATSRHPPRHVKLATMAIIRPVRPRSPPAALSYPRAASFAHVSFSEITRLKTGAPAFDSTGSAAM